MTNGAAENFKLLNDPNSGFKVGIGREAFRTASNRQVCYR